MHRKARIMIGLLKLLAHCPIDAREKFFEEIESMYKTQGVKYKELG